MCVLKAQQNLLTKHFFWKQKGGERESTSIKFFLFIYLFLAVLGLRCCAWASLVASRGGYFLVVVCRLLIVVASLAAGHGLQEHGFRSCSLQTLEHMLSSCVHGLSCSTTRGIVSDQESNSRPLHWQAYSYPLCHQESHRKHFCK